jgi:hypothetical protein
MSMSPGDRLIPSECVVTRIVNGSTVLLNTDTGRYFTLDDVGGRAWTVLTSSPSIQDARDRLLDEYAVDPVELMHDLDALIASLRQQGLVEVGRG